MEQIWGKQQTTSWECNNSSRSLKILNFWFLHWSRNLLKLTLLCTIIVPRISLSPNPLHCSTLHCSIFQGSDFIYFFFLQPSPVMLLPPLLHQNRSCQDHHWSPCCSKGQFSGLTLTSRQHSTVDQFLLLQVFSSPNFQNTTHLLVFLLPNWFVPTQLLCKFFSSDTF